MCGCGMIGTACLCVSGAASDRQQTGRHDQTPGILVVSTVGAHDASTNR